MHTEVAETIFEKVKILPVESQREALEFVEKLVSRENKPRLRIFEKIDGIVGEKPAEVWAEVPPDASINADHYLYGAKKK